MEIKYKAFYELDDKTLKAVYAPTRYKVGKTKVFKKCPAFVVEDISFLKNMFDIPNLSAWEVAVDDKVEIPVFLLRTDELTPHRIRSFWNGEIPGRMFGSTLSLGYMKIKPIRKVAEIHKLELRFL